MKRTLAAASCFLLLACVWEWLVRSEVWSPMLIPTPSEVARYLFAALKEGSLFSASLVTVKRLLLGYAFGVCVGLPLGLLTARFAFLQDTLGLVALGLITLPSVCWAPLAVIWFGQTELAMFFIVIMGSVWSIILATEHGVRSVPPIYPRAAQTMGSRGIHTWGTVILPASLPFIISGMKQGWAFAWRSLMAAEIYITILTGFGLGQELHNMRELHDMEAVTGIMLVIILIGLATDKMLFAPFERMLHRRWGTSR